MCSKQRLNRILVTALALVLAVVLFTSTMVHAKRDRIEFVLPDTSSAEVATNRHTRYTEAAVLSGERLTTEGFEKKLENDTMELWLSEEIASIRVVDKKSGYIWGALPEAAQEDLNDYWVAIGNSMLTIEYYDETNSRYQVSLSDPSFETEYIFDDEEDRMSCWAGCYDVGIDLEFEILLKEDHLEVAIVKDSLQEYDVNKICKVYLLPFFGCTAYSEQMDGYIFVPDGSGALMRFDSHNLYASGYTAKVYGPDAGIDAINEVNDLMAKRTDDYLVDTYRATLPVFGIVHGAEQYAAMTVIDSGREFASIEATLATASVPYNRAAVVFEYRQLYKHPTGKTSTVIQPQANVNKFTPRFSIYLLSGDEASYGGMALKYRSMLEEDGVLQTLSSSYKEIPMRLEILGSDIKSGFIFNSTRTFTTADEAKQIQADLAGMNINNLTMVYNGWQKGGSSSYKYGSFKTQKSVGSLSDLEELRDAVTGAGGNFYLQLKMVIANESQGRPTYLATTTIGQQLVYYMRDNPTVMFPKSYVVSPTLVAGYLQNATKKLAGFNLYVPRFGGELYSENKQNATMTRPATRRLFTKTAKQVMDNGQQLAMDLTNQYMWQYCTDYFDIPMANSQYLFETDSVPFLQMLLKGYINYYAPYANQGFYSTSAILKTIEYGAYPSFLVMAAENEDLNETPQIDYFSLNFDDWKSTINTVYSKTNAALQQVEGAHMVAHRVLAEGVVRVTYDNGVSIYVNYNSFDSTVDGVTVPGLNFVAERS